MRSLSKGRLTLPAAVVSPLAAMAFWSRDGDRGAVQRVARLGTEVECGGTAALLDVPEAAIDATFWWDMWWDMLLWEGRRT